MSWESVSIWIEQHPGLASWVQAVGSIAALGVAIWIASAQRRSDLKASEEKTRLLAIQVKTLATRASRAMTFEKTDHVTTMAKLNLLTRLCLSFERIDLLNLPDPEMLEPVCTLRDSLRALESGMRYANQQNYLETWLTLKTARLWIAMVQVSAAQVQKIG